MTISPTSIHRSSPSVSSSRAHLVRPRTAVLAAILTGALVAGCGGSGGPAVASLRSPATSGPSSTTASSSTSSELASTGHRKSGSPIVGMDAALAYAKCIQTHGLPNYPDPRYQGPAGAPRLLIDVPLPNTDSGFNAGAPQVIRAADACAAQRGAVFGPPSAALLASEQHAAFAFTSCMHAHGIAGWRTTVINNQGVGTDPTPQAVFRLPGFKAAYRTCSTQSGSGAS